MSYVRASLLLALFLPFGVTADILRRTAPPAPVLEERSSKQEHEYHQHPPEMDPDSRVAPFELELFRPDPVYSGAYDVQEQLDVYGGKTHFAAPRPAIEWGYPMYSEGPFGAGRNWIGRKNLVRPQFLVYGDWRTAVAFNDNGETEVGQVATRLNLDLDLRLTATERLHAFLRPLDKGGDFTRVEFAGDDANTDRTPLEFDLNLETLFFEGDVAALQSGFTDEYAQYDLPFAFGLMPLFLQNGIWLDDAFTGAAVSIPARNSPRLDITNFDVTFFVGFDKLSSLAFIDADGKLDDHAADMYGIATFMDVREGYFEAAYAYLKDDRKDRADFSYHNFTLAWTRRYGGWLSNSLRLIGNAGQNPGAGIRQTADGFALLIENSLITHLPSTLIPYANFFIGIDRPQAVARGGDGLLENTGINFETDDLTGFPRLDDSANDAWGGAIGVEYLFNLDQQLVVEIATVQTIGGNRSGRVAPDDQYALGIRYQRPIASNLIVRVDAMVGSRAELDDIAGTRMELRLKF